MKAIHLPPEIEKKLATLMIRGLIELDGRNMQSATALETLGMLGMRLLFNSEQLQFKPIMEEAILQVSNENPTISLQLLRDNLDICYNNIEGIDKLGISFHTVQ